MKKEIFRFLIPVISLPFFIYFGAELIVYVCVNTGARQLLNLEKKGLLSRKYGYVWQEINDSREMKKVSGKISGDTISGLQRRNHHEGKIRDFPSLAAIKELNEIRDFHKTITITDRHGITLAQLQTTHTCVFLSDLNDVLISSLLTTEDKNFFKRKSAYDFNALARAISSSLWKSLRSFRLHRPRGSSTIHMQVARFLLMKYDKRGYAYSEQNLARKFQEIKLAQALKLTYSNQDILTAYVNHCVSAGRGMQGYHDISMRLFGVRPKDLSLAQSLYLARLVKWNRQVPTKIINQIKTSMPSLTRHFRWTEEQQVSILQCLDTLKFLSATNLIPEHSHLIDLANEYWKQICEINGITNPQLAEMDIADPQSMIRRYGNLTITLTIDYRLQSMLEQIVDCRGFGPDTTIRSDKLIGSEGNDFLFTNNIPPDTLRKITILSNDSVFKFSGNAIHLHPDDTLIQNILYKKVSNHIRRSCFTYCRDTVTVAGQYFAYAIMNSGTRELLAYYSRDRLGSRLQSMLRNRIPNGSSTAKPLVYALAYDLGVYSPTDMSSDDVEVDDSCAWARHFYGPSEKPNGMTYHLAAEKSGYTVHNHHKSFDGYDYLFNHLANSNNIMAVETMYRLNTDLVYGNELSEKIRSFFSRTGTGCINNGNYITGPSLYAAIASICTEPSALDSINHIYQNRYSVALGTLELSLYEQLHLFNVLYDGNLIVKPSKHPGLFVKKIELAGNEVRFDDSIVSRNVFDTITKINPVHLGLHKRLVSSNTRVSQIFDICDKDGHNGPVSNFAKSGTTDDVIKPYYSEKTDKSRTNYGLWNAVLRLNLKKEDLLRAMESNPALNDKKHFKQLNQEVPEKQIIDVTLACIGECNQQHTGSPDGKTLHSYVSESLLKHFGIPCSSGFYQSYEQQIKQETSDKVKYADFRNESDLSGWSKFMVKLKTGFRSNITGENLVFEQSRFGDGLRLKGRSYRAMLRFGPYMGKGSKRYLSLIEQLRGPLEMEGAMKILTEIGLMEIRNKYLGSELKQACGSLMRSAQELGVR